MNLTRFKGSPPLRLRILRYGPILVAVLYSVGAVLGVSHLRRVHERLAQQTAAIAFSTGGPVEAEPSAANRPSIATIERQVQHLKEELAAEISSTSSARARAEELAARMSMGSDEVTTSFGRIDQMAGQTSEAIKTIFAQIQNPAAMKDPATMEKLTNSFKGLVLKLPLIKDFEERPEEISRFMVDVLGDFLDLDAAQSSRLFPILTAEFSRLKEDGLDAARKPTEPEAEKTWIARRDEAMRKMAAQIAPAMVGDSGKTEPIAGILNLGEGLRNETKMGADGHGSVKVYLPGFPSGPVK